jgi:Cu2+-exporting ATPase
MSSWFHCAESIPEGADFSANIAWKSRYFCCAGCMAVSQTITDSGLDSFYHKRDRASVKVGEESASVTSFAIYDDSVFNQDFTDVIEHRATTKLLVEGITCVACGWLIEKRLAQIEGVWRASLISTSHKLIIEFDASKVLLSQLVKCVHQLGYTVHPYNEVKRQQTANSESRRLMKRLGVAGFGMMQVMMFAVALYAGAWQGMDSKDQVFLHWVSLIVAVPVVFYSGFPFFHKAWRGLRGRQLNMDVPVSIALILAFGASAYATFSGEGEVYYDSVTMFVFFLLCGRFIEHQTRTKGLRHFISAGAELPVTSHKKTPDGWQQVAAKSILPDDIVLVASGAIIPNDGVVVSGTTQVNEALLTGESMPIPKAVGDKVYGGSVNQESPIQVKVTATHASSLIGKISHLMDAAMSTRPKSIATVDRWASWFVCAVLLISLATYTVWHFVLLSDDAFWVTLSVLVVTCPCALSLATPAAIVNTIQTMASKGIVVTRSEVIEQIASIKRVVFDKTGTLTSGDIQISRVEAFDPNYTAQQCFDIAAGLEQYVSHPIAQALVQRMQTRVSVSRPAVEVGRGVSGEIGGQVWYLGSAEWISAKSHKPSQPCDIYLATESAVIAGFYLSDNVRPNAATTVSWLNQLGLKLSLLSGDRMDKVAEVARQCQIEDFYARSMPEQKLAQVKHWQSSGEAVLMIGDGMNDAPVLSASDVSVAMGEGTHLAQANADMLLVSNDLASLKHMFELAATGRRIIVQNLLWAIGYNVTVLPVAMAGWVPPYLAAIGMSLSSLIVIINASRITRK